MLGWEYPPHISGGLGTACEGLTTALARIGVEIDFVVPRLFGGETAPHMSLIDSVHGTALPADRLGDKSHLAKKIKGVRTVPVPARLSPYWSPSNFQSFVDFFRGSGNAQDLDLEMLAARSKAIMEEYSYDEPNPSGGHYSYDMFEEVARFTTQVVALMADEQFDLIHAHDWMTFPAGIALSQITGKPLVLHVHSLEFDRSGNNPNAQIFDVERFGLQGAHAVIGVSYYTKSVIAKQHGVSPEKIFVVHNGVYPKELVQSYKGSRAFPNKIVLFLGRITFQKGPDYFVEAAARVIPHVPDVLFVMAGSGDMLTRMIHRVHELGIEEHFQFPGFLRGEEVEQMFSLADLYVMPSVSEPFGISALEAISFETPVIISRQSGVSEVLSHALKVDFWDLDKLADLMINALLHEELRQDMVSMAREEVRRLHWDAAALKIMEIYRNVQQWSHK